MCKDCGCSITDHHLSDDHDDLDHHHHHHHEDHHHHDHHHETISSNPQLNDPKTIAVITKILNKNDEEARHNREHFEDHKVLAINLMSSAGSGKTTMLEQLAIKNKLKFAVIEGDLETNKDADRIRAKGIQAYQIQTGSACHLDAFMVHKALHHIALNDIDICFIENVGNLVCPASYDVGAHLNIVLLSVPEGADKVEKYPVMFRSADLVVITKTDLLAYFDFDTNEVKKSVKKLKPSIDVLELNTKDDSIDKLIEWIEYKIKFRS